MKKTVDFGTTFIVNFQGDWIGIKQPRWEYKQKTFTNFESAFLFWQNAKAPKSIIENIGKNYWSTILDPAREYKLKTMSIKSVQQEFNFEFEV